MIPARACACFLVILALAGCVRRHHDDDATTAPAPEAASDAPTSTAATEDAAEAHTILVAPVALGPLEAKDAAGRLGFAEAIGERLRFALPSSDAHAERSLPASDAQEWTSGAPPAASDAALVVLTRVLDLTTSDSGADATVEMRAFDPGDDKGTPVFFKKAHGHASTGISDIPGATSASGAAVWDACATLVGALAGVLTQGPTQTQGSAPSAGAAIQATVGVDVVSQPDRADVLVDGVFAGATPLHLTLPTHPVQIRIEHAGFEPWVRQLTPVAGMKIMPTLVAGTGASGSTSPAAMAPAAPTPQPTRAQLDPTLAPPTPPVLDVPPGQK